MLYYWIRCGIGINISLIWLIVSTGRPSVAKQSCDPAFGRWRRCSCAHQFTESLPVHLKMIFGLCLTLVTHSRRAHMVRPCNIYHVHQNITSQITMQRTKSSINTLCDPVYMSRKIRKFRTDKFDSETNGNFDSCNSCKRLVPSRLHELHESKFPFVSLSNLSVRNFRIFSAHVYGVCETEKRTGSPLCLGRAPGPGTEQTVAVWDSGKSWRKRIAAVLLGGGGGRRHEGRPSTSWRDERDAEETSRLGNFTCKNIGMRSFLHCLLSMQLLDRAEKVFPYPFICVAIWIDFVWTLRHYRISRLTFLSRISRFDCRRQDQRSKSCLMLVLPSKMHTFERFRLNKRIPVL